MKENNEIHQCDENCWFCEGLKEYFEYANNKFKVERDKRIKRLKEKHPDLDIWISGPPALFEECYGIPYDNPDEIN